MNQAQPDQITVKGGILKIKSFNRYLISRWRILITVTIIGGVLGLLYATFRKPNYTAEFTFVISENSGAASGGGLGQYSALASMAGIDVGGSGGLFDGDNIVQLYKSRLMLAKTLLTKVSLNGKTQLLIDKYIEINSLRNSWNDKAELKNISFDTTKVKFGILQDSLLILISNDINKKYLTIDKPDKKLSVISVKVNARDPLFAKAFTETIVANVNKFYVDTKTKGSSQNVRLFQHQVDSIRLMLSSSLRSSASAIDSNPDPNPAMQILRVPSQRRQIDVQANSALYAEAVKNLEVAKSVLMRETPLIQVIDKPMLPLPNDRVSRSKGTLTGGIIAFMIALVVISVFKMYNSILN